MYEKIINTKPRMSYADYQAFKIAAKVKKGKR